MSEKEELARRFLGLWGDYLAALVADPRAAELLQRWLALGIAALEGWPQGEPGATEPAGRSPRSAARTAAAAGASGERDDALAEFARRLAEVERRLAAIERRGRASPPARGRDRAGRS